MNNQLKNLAHTAKRNDVKTGTKRGFTALQGMKDAELQKQMNAEYERFQPRRLS